MTTQLTPGNIAGFKVIVTFADGGKEVDSAWESCTGGALNIEIADSSTGTDPARTTTPGHKYVGEIVLRGPLTPDRKWIGKIITDRDTGRATRCNLTIVEINRDGSDGRQYTYHDCFPTRYVYPRLSADGTGNLYEEVSLKPQRLELS